MKKYRLVFAQKNKDTFKYIKVGKKKIETRAATEKYIGIESGDVVVLVCGNKSFQKKVKKVEHFPSLRKLFNKHRPATINPSIKTEKEMTEKYHSFPGYKEKIKKFGILALTLE